jgi:hypothetical protein
VKPPPFAPTSVLAQQPRLAARGQASAAGRSAPFISSWVRQGNDLHSLLLAEGRLTPHAIDVGIGISDAWALFDTRIHRDKMANVIIDGEHREAGDFAAGSSATRL